MKGQWCVLVCVAIMNKLFKTGLDVVILDMSKQEQLT